jgi:small subunit ribosomal protein S1
VKKIKDNMEKTTLGDLEILANLKSDMEQAERDNFEKRMKSKSKKEEEKSEPSEE